MALEEDLPRRMKRFYRDEQEEKKNVKDRSGELALKGVDSFKETHDRYPNREELEEISANVFDQLKKELSRTKEEEKDISENIEFGDEEQGSGKRAEPAERGKSPREKALERKQKREEKKKKPDEKAKEQKQTIGEEFGEPAVKEPGEEFDEPEGGETGELLGEEEPMEDASTEAGSPLKELVGMDELSKLEDDLDEEDDSDVIDKEMSTTLNTCPTCNNKAKQLIYCPNCGDAFCDHCSKKVEVLSDSIKYTCPKCSAEVKKKKAGA